MTQTSHWTQALMRSQHPPALKRLVLSSERFVEGLAKDKELSRPHFEAGRSLRAHTKSMAGIAVQAGRDWVSSFLTKGHEKTAAVLDWNVDDDIDEIVSGLNEAPTDEIRQAFHEAALEGGANRQMVERLAREYHIERARDIARTVYMNVFAKSALREMKRHGYEQCRRMEIDDARVCLLCRLLNTNVYNIEALLELPNPLTHDTHPRCRGTFVPVLNTMTTHPLGHGKFNYVRQLKAANGKDLVNVPAEYAPHLAGWVKRQALPWKVVFDPSLPVHSRLAGPTLSIHPKALFDEDPRELISEMWARHLWPKYEDKFRNEYVLLSQMGLVHPSKTVKTTEEFWINEFTAYKLGQFDTPWEMIWFKTNVKE